MRKYIIGAIMAQATNAYPAACKGLVVQNGRRQQWVT